MDNVYLIGFMGVGKSTVARSMEKRLGWRLVDLDRRVEERAGKSVAEIFRTDGETVFRRMEKDILLEVSGASRTIISCGGGTALDPDNVAVMKANGRVIWLDADVDVILERVSRRRGKRPLLKGKTDQDIIVLYEARREAYRSAGDYRVMSDDRSSYAVAAKIQKILQIPFEVRDERLKGGRFWQRGSQDIQS